MLIGGVSSHPSNLARPLGTRAISGDAPISSLIRDAKEEELVPVLLLDGTQNDAESTARKFPDLKLIVYRSSSESPLRPLRVGQTLLVTPGQFGKKVVSLSFDGKAFSDYQVVALGPDLVDDRDVSKLYKSYLHRVDQAGFLDRIVRKPSGAFAGTTACGQCHISSLRAWKNSTHALALANLEAQGHGRDPDCVTCHVVGLNLQGGYRSRLKTPDMANVGCESCHGSGARHSQKPLSIKMSKVGTVMCAKCHNPDQSPGFNPITFWGRIKHR